MGGKIFSLCLPAATTVVIRSSGIDSSNFGLTICCARNADVTDEASFDVPGLSTGFASIQMLLLGKEIILLDRFGSSGAIIAELSDIVSENSATDAAIELKFICDWENIDGELP